HRSRFFSITLRPPPTLTLFPYTTLFRSVPQHAELALPPDEHLGLEAALHRQRFARRRRARGRALPLAQQVGHAREVRAGLRAQLDRKSTRLNSSHVSISYAVFCLKKKIT